MNEPTTVTSDFTGTTRSIGIVTDASTGIESTLGITKYYVNGALHRENGPALIRYIDGKSFDKQWWLEGVRMPKDEFQKNLEKIYLYRALNIKLHSAISRKNKNKKI